MAVITELEGDYATITELQLTGQASGGSGAVELSCLERPEPSPVWRAAYAVYKQHALEQEAMLAEAEVENAANRRKRRRALKIVADKNGMEPKALHKLLKELEAAGVINYQ